MKGEQLLKTIGQEAAKRNLKAWVVGGYARDFYLGKKTVDIDICVERDASALINFCRARLGASVRKFDAFGTARCVLPGGFKLDFVRCRREVYTKPGALPQVAPSNLRDDLFRRDFTANALALSILPTDFLQPCDYFGALDAIKGRYIKVLHNKSFIDDPTRIYRALRFAGRLNWKLEASTEKLLKEAIKQQAPLLISRERMQRELIKILQEKRAKQIFALLKKYQAAGFFYPGLKWDARMDKTAGIDGKILCLAIALGRGGKGFLQSLHLPRAQHQPLLAAWKVCAQKLAPLKALPPALTKTLRLFTTAPAAARQSFLTGADLGAAGKSGPQIGALLTILRRLQYEGKIKTKAAALKVLKTL